MTVFQGYEDSQWSSYHDDRRPGPKAYDRQEHYDHDERSYGPNRKKHVASEPSPHVILLGLDFDFTEADVRS